MKKIKERALFLAKPHIVFYTLIWLMILLVAGTVAQKYIGLYRAQNMFFSSWLVWWGPIPFPGGLTTLGFLTLSLMAKLFFASRWSWQNSGTIITHVGALLLLIGGLNLAAIGVSGQYFIRILDVSSKKPAYIIRDTMGGLKPEEENR